MERKISISVRNLVEFILRSGDIDQRFKGSDRMLEGTAAHKRLQKAAGAGYQAEVYLAYDFSYADFEIHLDGRADGVITGPDGVTVDEIKSTVRPLDQITEDFSPLHWAQAKCYAFMLARLEKLESVSVRLTYCEPEGDGVLRFQKDFSEYELTEFVHGLFDRYMLWAEYESERTARRDASIRALQFPFESYRPGQRAFAASVYRAITGRRVLFAQAPTGIGKTLSTLFPSVKAIGEGQVQKIFYLTAKTVTRKVAENAIACMRGLGADFKAVTLTAKDKICPHPQTACNPDECELARGYYDRVNDALYCLLNAECLFTRDVIERFSEDENLCPFEFGLDLSEWADCIICDYNYVFDPIVYLRRYFQNAAGEYVFLVDEAHNLIDRSRDIYSAELEKSSFLEIKKLYKTGNRSLAKAAGAVNRHFLELGRQNAEEEQSFRVLEKADSEIFRLLSAFIRQADRHLSGSPAGDENAALLDLYFRCLRFMKISEFYDEHYATLVRTEGAEVRLKLFCLDPSSLLAEVLALGKGTVFFSATLSPAGYYRRLLGGAEGSPAIRLPSPFDPSRLCLLVADGISTRYRDRANSLSAVAGMILGLALGKPGNYIAYFPSYQYMSEVYDAFLSICPEGVETVRQDAGMTDADREEFLAEFHPRKSTLVGFCVLGGAFSEGIDLTGDRLIGTAVVGVGLPQINPELDLIRSHFDEQEDAGYEYAYQYPGMNKVLQAAGRVIRTSGDRGVVLLIDDRFTRRDYLTLFPPHWSHFRRVRSDEELKKALSEFWKEPGN